MDLNETNNDGRSFLTCDRNSGWLRLQRQSKSLAFVAFVALFMMPALSTKTFAQVQREPRAEGRKPAQPEPPSTAPIVLGTSAQTVEIPGSLNVGNGRMQVVSSAIGGGVLTSNLYIRQLNQQPSPAHLCWRVAPDGVQGLLLTPCTTSQSSLRYKTDLRPFLGGLNVINRLKPYDFAWKTGGTREIGLIAEDVARVEPLLTFKNSKDEIEGVKYENLNVVFINAFKEQQAQIDELRQLIKTQQEQLKQQAQQIESMKKGVLP